MCNFQLNSDKGTLDLSIQQGDGFLIEGQATN